MALEKGLTKNEIISILTKTAHAGGAGKRTKGEKLPKLTPEAKRLEMIARLDGAYGRVGRAAIIDDPDFYAHLVAWNHQKGAVRDAKVALPIYGLGLADPAYRENSLAHLADLRPREFLRAMEYARQMAVGGQTLRRLIARWLAETEVDPGWEATALRHRATLRTLYARWHIKPGLKANAVLFQNDYAKAPRFEAVRQLTSAKPEVVAGLMLRYHLPFLTVRAALGKRMTDPDILMAVIKAMTPTELVTNMTGLEKLGVKNQSVTRATLEQALAAAGTKGAAKVGFKATVAAAAVGDDQLSGKLKALQQKAIETLKGVEGDWLVLGDRSSSMAHAVELAKGIAAMLTAVVKGKVRLTFFNTSPTAYDVTGLTLDQIQGLTRGVTASGSTAMGCGIVQATDAGFIPQGIVVIGDGEDNTAPRFYSAYLEMGRKHGATPSVYFYWTNGSGEPFRSEAERSGIDLQLVDLRQGVDYTSLPNLIQTMRVGRYSLLDEVMATPLRTLDEVLDHTLGMVVVPRGLVTA